MARRRMKHAFFDREAVLKQLSKAEKRVLPKIGAFIRRTAKSSLRMGKLIKLSDMTADDKKAWKRRKRIRKQQGLGPPPRRRQSAKPLHPPRLHDKNSPLKRLLYFAFDSRSHSVVVGPEFFSKSKSGGKAPRNLEKGKDGHRQFPFMGPAMAKEIPKLPAMWRNAVKK